jgi:hypothetical protein
VEDVPSLATGWMQRRRIVDLYQYLSHQHIIGGMVGDNVIYYSARMTISSLFTDYQCMYPSIYPCIHYYIYPFIDLFISFIPVSLPLSIYLLIHLSIYLSSIIHRFSLSGIRNIPWDLSIAKSRNLTAVYLGSIQTLNPTHTKIRRAMTTQCNASTECHWLKIDHSSKDMNIADYLSVYKKAVFCLCPPGKL